MNTHFLTGAAAFFALALASLAQLPLTYDSNAPDPDPTTQGWTAGGDVSVGSDSSPIDGLVDSTGNANAGPVSANPETGSAWQLNDQQGGGAFDLPFYSQTFSTTEASGLLNTTGFRMTAKIRAVANHNTTFAGQDWCGFLDFRLPASLLPGDSDRRIGFAFGIGVSNQFQIFNEQNTTPTLVDGTNTANDFHTLEVVLLPGATHYAWFLNGDCIATLSLESGTAVTSPNPLATFSTGTSSGIGGTFDILSFRIEELIPRVIHVDASVSGGGNDGTSWANAYSNLQDALASACLSDQIWVAQGTYYPDEGASQTDNDRTSTFQLKSNVRLYGGFDGTETELDQRDFGSHPTILSGDIDQNDVHDDSTSRAGNAYHVLTADNVAPGTSLNGFHIHSGNANGTAVNVDGGGLSCLGDSTLSLTNCSFRGNSASENGGAIATELAGYAIDFTNCSFQGNYAGNYGGAIYCDNNSFAVDPSKVERPSTFTNCSFQGNCAGDQSGALLTYSTDLNFYNTIMWDNKDSSTGFDTSSLNSSVLTAAHCLIQGFHSGNFDAFNLDGRDPSNDPLFVSPIDPSSAPSLLGDLRLQSGSPVLVQGDSSLNSEALDLAGNLRIAPFGTIDLGAYELQEINHPPYPDLLALLPPTDGNHSAPNWTPDSSSFNGGNGFLYTFSNPTGDLVFTTPPTVASDGTLSFEVPAGTEGTITFDLVISDPSGAYQPTSSAQTIRISVGTAGRYYVDESVIPGANGGVNNGVSWTHAFPDLQTALATVPTGVELWVAAGTYYPDEGLGQIDNDRDASFHLQSGIAIYGGFQGTETARSQRNPSTNPTTLSGEIQDDADLLNNSRHVLTATSVDATSILDGFIIRDGSIGMSDSGGGGLLCDAASPTIANCFFTANFTTFTGAYGGAVHCINTSSPSFTNCAFKNNRSTDNTGQTPGSAGAVYSEDSTLSFTNCIFQGNRAGRGGAIWFRDSSATLINCTLQGNLGSLEAGGGAIHLSNSSLNLRNCVIWNNAETFNSFIIDADNPTESIRNDNSTLTTSHCLIANWSPAALNGTNNLDGTDTNNAPLFVQEVDPALAPISGGDLRLLTGSPVLDAGLNSANSTSTDLAGNPRIQNTTIDLGAYEGAFTTFAHEGFSNPTADDNNNGNSNYLDYALGADPTAPNDPSPQPGIANNQLTFSFRNNAADVFVEFQKSTTLLPDSWSELILGTDYTLSSEAINGTTTTQTLDLSNTLLLNNDALFFREGFSEEAPE